MNTASRPSSPPLGPAAPAAADRLAAECEGLKPGGLTRKVSSSLLVELHRPCAVLKASHALSRPEGARARRRTGRYRGLSLHSAHNLGSSELRPCNSSSPLGCALTDWAWPDRAGLGGPGRRPHRADRASRAADRGRAGPGMKSLMSGLGLTSRLPLVVFTHTCLCWRFGTSLATVPSNTALLLALTLASTSQLTRPGTRSPPSARTSRTAPWSARPATSAWASRTSKTRRTPR
jgi:hypothetical protein